MTIRQNGHGVVTDRTLEPLADRIATTPARTPGPPSHGGLRHDG